MCIHSTRRHLERKRGYDFGTLPSGADGYQPVAGLTRDSKGYFYGTTTKGVAVYGKRPCDCGVVYELMP